MLYMISWSSPNGEMDEGYIDFDQPYKQTGSKMLVAGKI